MLNESSDASRLRELIEQVSQLFGTVHNLQQRLDALEGRGGAFLKAAPLPPLYQPQAGDTVVAIEKIKKSRGAGEMEAIIGGQWLAKIGVLALILGISFFLKYAFDNNWIGPAGRVGIGILAGVALLGLGEFFRKRYATYSQILSGGGVAVLYLSTYAAYGFYHLVPSQVAFLFMTVVTLVAGAISVLTNQVALVAIGIAGGFLTPLLLSSGQNQMLTYFSYSVLLDVGILGVSFYRNWRVLNLLGLAGTAILYATWYSRFYTVEQQWTVVMFLAAYFLIFLAATAAHNIVNKKKSETYDLLLLAFNGFGFFLLLYGLFDGDKIGMSFTALGLGILYFGLAVLSHEFNPEDKVLSLSLPALSVVFLTIAVGLILDQSWLTLGWAVEALLLVWLSFTLKEKFYRGFAAVVSVLVLARLLALEIALKPEEYTLLLNKRLAVFLISVACLSGAGWLYRQYKATVSEKEYKFVKAIVVCANVLMLVALSAEVVDFYGAQMRVAISAEAANVRCLPNNVRCIGSAANYERLRSLRQSQSITLSILWALYAVGVIAVGFARKSQLLRVGGILLIGFTLLKFFLYDLWGLGSLYRIIISIVLGVLLLLASFGYNKYKDRIKGMIS